MENQEEAKPCKCNPNLDLSQWDNVEKEISKTFYKVSVPHFLFMPLGFEKKANKAVSEIKEKNFSIPEEQMFLSQDKLFSGSILIEINDQETDDANVIKLSGKFKCKVHKGPWNKIGKISQELIKETGSKEIYNFYLTCPRCVSDPEKHLTIVMAKLG